MRTSLTVAITFVLTSLVVAQVVRDVDAAWMLWMCVPAWPVALIAIGWDARLRWRALRGRGLLSAIAVAAGAFALAAMRTPARAPEGTAGMRALRVVQWNTQWGGRHEAAASRAMIDALDAQEPDVVCLSEAPRREHFDPAWSARQPGWFTASVENPPRPSYWYRLTVTSRHPVALKSEWDLPSGHVALFEVAVPRHTVRVLMVDLESTIGKLRSPSIERVARYVARVPADLIVGDFNATARFRGFESLEALGYRRAALWSGAWRATWPSFLPLLDIDHVWVRGGLDVMEARFFRSPGIDHRGQRATLRLPH